MFENLKISAKFNLFLMLVFIISIIVSGVTLSNLLQQRAQDEVASKALVLIETMTSIRDYTFNRITPQFLPKLETEPTFISDAIPAFSAKEVFELLRKKENYENFFYKPAALNPTNLADKADQFETQLIERFRHDSNSKEISGFRNLPEGHIFYITRPIAITKQSCLQCHYTPAQAPKSQLTAYGTENGFGWKFNEIIGAEIVYVPAQEVFNKAHRNWSLIMGLFVAIFTVVVLLINFLIKKTILQRIRKMEKIAQKISTGDMSANFEEKSNDEIGGLAAAFNRMKSSLEIALKLLSNTRSN